MKVYGKNVFNELDLKKVRKVYLSKNFNDKDIINIIKINKLKYVNVDQKVLDGMFSHNQGIVVEINDYDYKSMKDINFEEKMILILDHLEDPHNFGAIIRTCEAKGIKTIVIPKDRSVIVNETVMKTSSGALSNVNIVMVNNLVKCIDEFKNKGYFVYGAEANGTDYKNVDYSDKVCLVIGSEGNGLSRLVMDACDEIISIPMRGKVNSLNASVAAAILIYGIGE